MTRTLYRDTVSRAALDYIERGWPVFMLGRSKRPVRNCLVCRPPAPPHDGAACDCLTCHGFYAATLDPGRFAALREAIPGGLLAIRTGTVSGLCIVDIDPRNGGRIDHMLMTPTATVATGGGGWHLYYRHPGGPSAAKVAGCPGVDVKADGGYVCAPPAIHPGTRRPYRWVRDGLDEMPAPLRAAITPAPPTGPAPQRATVTTTRRNAAGITSPDRLLTAHLDAIANAAEGTRRTTLYGAARGVARMVAAGAITATDAVAELTAAGLETEQTPRDIRAAITGGFGAEGVAL